MGGFQLQWYKLKPQQSPPSPGKQAPWSTLIRTRLVNGTTITKTTWRRETQWKGVENCIVWIKLQVWVVNLSHELLLVFRTSTSSWPSHTQQKLQKWLILEDVSADLSVVVMLWGILLTFQLILTYQCHYSTCCFIQLSHIQPGDKHFYSVTCSIIYVLSQ